MAQFSMVQSLGRLTTRTWHRWIATSLNLLRWFPVFCFLVAGLAFFTECRPFTHYWQVQPDPGAECRQVYGQLYVNTILGSLGDICIALLPISLLVRSCLKPSQKIVLCTLFGSSLLTAAFSIFRLIYIVRMHGNQQKRTLTASFQLLIAVAVANASVIGSIARNSAKQKRQCRASNPNPHQNQNPNQNQNPTPMPRAFAPGFVAADQVPCRGKYDSDPSTGETHRGCSNCDPDVEALAGLWVPDKPHDPGEEEEEEEEEKERCANSCVRQPPACDISDAVTPLPRAHSPRSVWHGEGDTSSNDENQTPSTCQQGPGCDSGTIRENQQQQPKPPKKAHIFKSPSTSPTDNISGFLAKSRSLRSMKANLSLRSARPRSSRI